MCVTALALMASEAGAGSLVPLRALMGADAACLGLLVAEALARCSRAWGRVPLLAPACGTALDAIVLMLG